jgi:hypothetical protein
MPIFIVTWKAEIRRIAVQTPSQSTKSWVQWQALVMSSYVGDQHQEDPKSKPTQAKKFLRSQFNRKKLGMVACTCHPRKKA